GRAVKLDVLPPPPLWRPRTRPLPLLRTRSPFRCFARPFRRVTAGRLPPNFDLRRLFPPALLRPATPRRPPGRVGRPARLLDLVPRGIILPLRINRITGALCVQKQRQRIASLQLDSRTLEFAQRKITTDASDLRNSHRRT